jgi:hypothetical protein
MHESFDESMILQENEILVEETIHIVADDSIQHMIKSQDKKSMDNCKFGSTTKILDTNSFFEATQWDL